VARVRALLRRSHLEHGATPPQVLLAGGLRLDVGRRALTKNGEPVELTPSEFELLHVLMKGPGYVFTRDELMEKALGYAYEGMGRTLDSHIKNLRRKIEPDPRKPTYIQTVYGVGYRLMEDDL
jgi:two-component system alkaline phosphatase synthesis response regulator PhoP